MKDYTDLIDWLMFLYENPRLKPTDEQVKQVVQAYTQTQRITQLIEQQENKLKNERNEIENNLVR